MMTTNDRRSRRPGTVRLSIERLEGRLTPSGGYLLVADLGGDQVLRYDGSTGAFVDTFVPKHRGGMNQPWGVLFGPNDGNLYVSTGWHSGPGQLKGVLRYDGDSGAFLNNFPQGGDLIEPLGIIFGPDGHLYAATGTHGQGGRVARFDGTTGAYLGDFVTRRSGGLAGPRALVFGPRGRGSGLDLYVSSGHTNSILRYDGTTGAFLGAYVAPGSGGLDEPVGLIFGPDGNLYVASSSYGSNGPREVLRFQGPSGANPGAFIDAFLPNGVGGLQTPNGILFGQDGNSDGYQDLYVSDAEYPGGPDMMGKNSTVKRFHGVTGAFLGTFVTMASGGLDEAMLMSFTRTDPVTLAYAGGNNLTAAFLPGMATNEMLAANQVQPLLTDAIARWQSAGIDGSMLRGFDVRITDLGGATLGLASGYTIWLDSNAAGWGWFVDPTPEDDSEFLMPGDQGEQNRMDLLTVLAHEIGHLLGTEHEHDGVMQETSSAGERLTPQSVAVNESWWLAGLPDLTKKRDPFGWWL